MILGAGSGGKTSSLRSSLGKSKQPGVIEPTLARSRQASAQFRRTAGRTRQLCIRSTPFHCNFAGCISVPLRSDGRKLPRPARTALRPKMQATKGRDAPHIGQVAIWPRDFVRPRHQQCGARLRLSPKTAAIARNASHGQGISIIREIGHFCPASISLAPLRRTETTELTWWPHRKVVGLTPRRQAAGRSAERAHAPIASQPTPYALPSWSQRIGFALARQSRERDPANWLLALRRRWHEGVLPGPHTTHIVRLVVPPTLILFGPTTPRARDPSGRN
jgi:hypothetical protein